MRKINKIIIHCSASDFGNAIMVDGWHQERNFAMYGYHYGISNGCPFNKNDYIPWLDGQIEVGRPESMVGSHCKGHNIDSIGIMLYGNNKFTTKQVVSVLNLCLNLITKYDLDANDVEPHNKYNKNKTCPNFNVEGIRAGLIQMREAWLK